MTTAIAVAAVCAGATIQSAIGFGYALVAAPVLAAVFGPEVAAPTLGVTALIGSGLLLAAEGRRPEILRREAAGLVAWSIPGMAVGALVLAFAPGDVLRLVVAASVLAAVALHFLRTHVVEREPATPLATAGVGAVSGAMSTSSGLNGPPMVLHLLGRASPTQTRDTLAAVFLATGVLSLAIFALSGTFEAAPPLLPLVAATAVGWAFGRRAVDRLRPHYERLSLVVLALGSAVALVLAVQAVG
jgi:uncharacterized membrane protein YfcA